jgi:formiminotetrahydrofolate cyclodeaminase
MDATMTQTPDAGGPYAERTVAGFLGAVATSGPGPAGGSVAAIGAALAASLVRLAATVSHAWPEAASVGERALHLERQLLDLADEDAAAWVHALRHRDDGDARLNARAVPLQIAAAALEVCELARRAVGDCAAHVRADAATAVHLATAAHEAALGVAAANEPS